MYICIYVCPGGSGGVAGGPILEASRAQTLVNSRGLGPWAKKRAQRAKKRPHRAERAPAGVTVFGRARQKWHSNTVYSTSIHTYSKFARRTIYTFISIQSIIRIEMLSSTQSSSRMKPVYSATGES